jgi:glycogen debranching enzyme
MIARFAPSRVLVLILRQTGDLPRLAKPAAWLKTRFDIINKTCPQFMRPKYFALVIVTAYKAARKAVVEQCSEFISSGHAFTHDLALAAVQQYGLVKSASINPAKPVPSLAAGLPHFAAGWARCWGRDVVCRLCPFLPLLPRALSCSRLPSTSILSPRRPVQCLSVR